MWSKSRSGGRANGVHITSAVSFCRSWQKCSVPVAPSSRFPCVSRVSSQAVAKPDLTRFGSRAGGCGGTFQGGFDSGIAGFTIKPPLSAIWARRVNRKRSLSVSLSLAPFEVRRILSKESALRKRSGSASTFLAMYLRQTRGDSRPTGAPGRKFDQGWDKVREETLARQIKLGVVPPNTQLTKR